MKNSMEKPSYIKSDYSDVKTLDLYNLEIVSTVLAQTVALNYYTIAVDKYVVSAEFSFIYLYQDAGNVYEN